MLDQWSDMHRKYITHNAKWLTDWLQRWLTSLEADDMQLRLEAQKALNHLFHIHSSTLQDL